MMPEPSDNAATAQPPTPYPPSSASYVNETRGYRIGLTATVVILCVLALPLLRGRIYKHDDLSRQHLPMRFFYAECLNQGESPIWMPDVLCGFYLHGDGVVGMFHPLHLVLYRTLPFSAAFNLELLLNYPFMLIGMFLFLRRWEIPRDAGMLGAFMFTFSGFNLLHYMHINAISVTAHIPWMLYFIDIVMRGTERRRVALARFGLSLFTASQLLLGHPQVFWFSSLIEFLYVLLLLRPYGNIHKILWLGSAKMLGVLAGCIQLVPSWDCASKSQRLLWPRSWPSLHPTHILQIIAPYYFTSLAFKGIPYELKAYNGAIAVVLGVLLGMRMKKLGAIRRLALGSFALGVISLVLSMGNYGYLYRLQSLLPFVQVFRAPCRYLVLFHLAAAVWTAVAFADLSIVAQSRKRPNHRLFFALFAVALISFMPLMARLWIQTHPQTILSRYFGPGLTTVHLIFVGPALFIVAAGLAALALRWNRYALAAIILFGVVDQGIYGLSYILKNDTGARLDSFKDFAPTPPGMGQYRIQTDDNTWILKGIRIADGYVSMPPERKLEPLSTARLRVAGVRWIWSKYDKTRYLMTGTVYGVPVPEPLPRVRLVTNAVVTSDPKRDIEAVDVASAALVEEPLRLSGDTPGTATLVADRPGRITVDTEADSPQLLILSESYHDGWRVSVDGKRGDTLRVYGDFVGCLVSDGKHRVEFVFKPHSLRIGILLSMVGIASAVCLLAISLRRCRSGVRRPAGRRSQSQ
ncbi:MAG: hypothetical protein C4532_08095 [Candidatus Abyssobacteria bacterium SURF_17]|uniref:YfhO family protein n=1 Tax=Candidatus Abyssobacteria bacterium SURF_17 TaxID=2093361 RepID=A0A419F019_9BACT|nr:MAG: hypothetical protein C4532_08095 [Candidatus Abyssubacteria bacterium SURF_17]